MHKILLFIFFFDQTISRCVGFTVLCFRGSDGKVLEPDAGFHGGLLRDWQVGRYRWRCWIAGISGIVIDGALAMRSVGGVRVNRAEVLARQEDFVLPHSKPVVCLYRCVPAGPTISMLTEPSLSCICIMSEIAYSKIYQWRR